MVWYKVRRIFLWYDVSPVQEFENISKLKQQIIKTTASIEGNLFNEV